MQAVKSLFFFLALCLCSCTIKDDNYKLSNFNSTSILDSAQVVLNVNDSMGNRFQVYAVKVNQEEIYNSESGQLTFKLPEGTYSFTGMWLHYTPVATELINLSRGDSIVIDFYLNQDTTKLY